MDLFIFRTAVPFGYLAFWAGVAVLAVIALALVVGGLRFSRKGPAIGGGLVLAGVLSLIGVNVAYAGGAGGY